LPTIAIVAYYDSFGVAPVSNTPYLLFVWITYGGTSYYRQPEGRKFLCVQRYLQCSKFGSHCMFKNRI
jgi:hypothetical protein